MLCRKVSLVRKFYTDYPLIEEILKQGLNNSKKGANGGGLRHIGKDGGHVLFVLHPRGVHHRQQVHQGQRQKQALHEDQVEAPSRISNTLLKV